MDKQTAWAKIQTDPKLAAFLTAINTEFGKPLKIKVVIGSETVVDTFNLNKKL